MSVNQTPRTSDTLAVAGREPAFPVDFLNKASRSRVDVSCSHAWIAALWRSGRLGMNPRNVTVYDQHGTLTAFFPLSVRWRTRRKVPLRYAIPFAAVYSARCSLPLDPVNIDNAVFVLQDVRKQVGSCTILEMPVETGSELDGLWRAAASQLGWRWRFSDRGVCPYLPLSGGKEKFLATRSSNFKMNIKRKLKNVENNYTTRMRTIVDREVVARAFSEVCDIEQESWKADKGTAFTSREDLRLLYKNMVLEASEIGLLRIYILEVSGYPIAFDIGLLHEGVYYMMKTSYRKSYASLSPGFVLRWYVLCDLWDIGASEHDFLWDRDNYKAQWTTEERSFGTYWLYPPGPLQHPLWFLSS